MDLIGVEPGTAPRGGPPILQGSVATIGMQARVVVLCSHWLMPGWPSVAANVIVSIESESRRLAYAKGSEQLRRSVEVYSQYCSHRSSNAVFNLCMYA